jgi:sugar lactone lactonase YvrE
MAKLRKVASFGHQVTGVTATGDGRIFVNFPRWTEDTEVSVAEVLPGGKLKPYPDEAWNAWRNAKAAQMPVEKHFVCVQSVVADGRGSLWVLDPAAPGNERVLPGGAKLVRIDLAADKVTKVIPFAADIALQGSYLNDIRFSSDGKTGFITDSGSRGAIIVVDLDSGDAFRALDSHPSTQPEKDVVVQVDGKPLRRPDGRQPVFASDGIAISRDGKNLLWQALTGRTLYSIPTEFLKKDTPPDKAAGAVTKVATTVVADGLWVNADDAILITSPTDNSVKMLKDGELDSVIQDAQLRWPDTLSEGPDGTIYVTASRIQDSVWFNPKAPIALPTDLFAFHPNG